MHETQIHVRWGELDSYNHVNHAVYLTYMETARIAALDSLGWGMGALEAAGTLILVADVKVRFRRPAVAGDTLRVTTEVIEVRGASSRWRQRILRGADLIVEAEVLGAITDLHGHPTRITPDLRQALNLLITSHTDGAP